MRKTTAVFILLSILLFSISQNPPVSAQDDCKFAGEVRIGVIAPITGDIYRVGQSTRNAIDMAVDEINADCGLEFNDEQYELVIVFANNDSEPEASAAAAEQLITEENVLAIIGPQSSRQAVPTGEVANELETPMISPWSTNPATTFERPWVFRMALLDPWQGQILAEFAMDHYEAETAAVLYSSDNDYSRGIAENFRDSFEALDGEIVAFEDFLTGDSNFSEQLAVIAESGADVFFVPQYYNEVPMIVLQALEMEMDIPIIGGDSWGTQELLELCSPFCEGMFFSSHYAPEIIDEMFVDDYTEMFGVTPDDVAALTYDAVYFLSTAIERAEALTREAIQEALANMPYFEGVTGVMQFTEEGDPIKCAVINQIVNDEFEYYETVCPPDDMIARQD